MLKESRRRSGDADIIVPLHKVSVHFPPAKRQFHYGNGPAVGSTVMVHGDGHHGQCHES